MISTDIWLLHFHVTGHLLGVGRFEKTACRGSTAAHLRAEPKTSPQGFFRLMERSAMQCAQEGPMRCARSTACMSTAGFLVWKHGQTLDGASTQRMSPSSVSLREIVCDRSAPFYTSRIFKMLLTARGMMSGPIAPTLKITTVYDTVTAPCRVEDDHAIC